MCGGLERRHGGVTPPHGDHMAEGKNSPLWGRILRTSPIPSVLQEHVILWIVGSENDPFYVLWKNKFVLELRFRASQTCPFYVIPLGRVSPMPNATPSMKFEG